MSAVWLLNLDYYKEVPLRDRGTNAAQLIALQTLSLQQTAFMRKDSILLVALKRLDQCDQRNRILSPVVLTPGIRVLPL